MSKTFRYLYLDVALPGDLFLGGNLEDFGQQAIMEAGERMLTYAIPAFWTAKLISGQIHESNEVVFRVCRKSLR